jgi:hypothetical protein
MVISHRVMENNMEKSDHWTELGKFQIEKKTCVLLTDVKVTERKRKEKKMYIDDLLKMYLHYLTIIPNIAYSWIKSSL